MVRLSATSIKTFMTCPRQYRYLYIEELPQPLTGPLAFGQVIHETLRRLYARSFESGSGLDLAYAMAEFETLWAAIVATRQPVFKEGPEATEHYRGLGQAILRGYVRAERHQPLPLLLEFPFELSLQCDNHEYLICGTVDRIDAGDAGVVIVDYKSGQRKPTPAALDQDLQLTLYAFAIEQALGQPVERISYYHLRSQISLLTFRTEGDLHQLTGEILPSVVQAIEAARFNPRPGYWCRWCPFYQRCQEEGFPEQT
jgi:RecB family exonuclease